MCGIVGIISKVNNGFTYSALDYFTQLLWTDAVRGFDSTGIFSVDNLGNLEVAKQKGNPSTFFTEKEYKKILDNTYTRGKFLIGHNRKATKGEITDENSHPFTEGDITLVHNGTIFNQQELDSDKKVDSNAICESINKKGLQDTLSIVNGSFAIIAYNWKKEILYLTRNSERPLHFADCGTFWMIASEDKLLEWIADRNNITMKQLYFVKENTIVSFKLKNTNTYNIEVLKEKPNHNFKHNTFFKQKQIDFLSKEKQITESWVKKNEHKNNYVNFTNDDNHMQKHPFRVSKPSLDYFSNLTYVNFTIDKAIEFTQPNEFGDGLITGTWLFNEKVKIQFFYKFKDLMKLYDNYKIDLFDDKIISYDYFSGKVVKVTQKKEIIVHIESIYPLDYSTSANGVKVCAEFLVSNAFPVKCSKCNKNIYGMQIDNYDLVYDKQWYVICNTCRNKK